MAETYNFDFTPEELQKPVTEIGLSYRSMKIVQRTDIKTLGDLIEYIQTGKILKLYGMGKVRLDDILKRLTEIQSPEYRDRLQEIAKRQKQVEKIDAQIKQLNKTITALHDTRVLYTAEIAWLNNLNRGAYM